MTPCIFHGSKPELYQKVLELKSILTGDAPDTQGVARGFLLAIGLAALSDIKEAFLIKAKGGTDAMGISWPPLQPSTISRRKVSKQDIKDNPDIKERVTIVRREYKKLLPGYLLALPQGKAQSAALRAAEIRATQLTGKTKVQVLGSRIVEILRDTGRLLNSISPGLYTVEGINVSYSPPAGEGGEDQILEYHGGRIIVGTNVEYAVYHDSKEPRKKLPRRQIFPDNEEQVPAQWWENWLDVGGQALETAAAIHFGTN